MSHEFSIYKFSGSKKFRKLLICCIAIATELCVGHIILPKHETSMMSTRKIFIIYAILSTTHIKISNVFYFFIFLL